MKFYEYSSEEKLSNWKIYKIILKRLRAKSIRGSSGAVLFGRDEIAYDSFKKSLKQTLKTVIMTSNLKLDISDEKQSLV